MHVSGHHRKSKKEKFTQHSLTSEHGQNQITFGRRERLSVARKIRSDEEKTVLVLDAPQACHDSCMLIHDGPRVTFFVARLFRGGGFLRRWAPAGHFERTSQILPSKTKNPRL